MGHLHLLILVIAFIGINAHQTPFTASRQSTKATFSNHRIVRLPLTEWERANAESLDVWGSVEDGTFDAMVADWELDALKKSGAKFQVLEDVDLQAAVDAERARLEQPLSVQVSGYLVYYIIYTLYV
jgi:hypothetical protein